MPGIAVRLTLSTLKRPLSQVSTAVLTADSIAGFTRSCARSGCDNKQTDTSKHKMQAVKFLLLLIRRIFEKLNLDILISLIRTHCLPDQ